MRLAPALLLLACAGCSLVRTPIEPVEALAHAEPPARFDHGDLDLVLSRFVDEAGLVDYPALEASPTELQRYYANVASFSPDSHPELFPTEADRLAYWINAYNASVLVIVQRLYPIDSVSNVRAPLLLRWFPANSGFFYFQGPVYGGMQTSLDYVENSVIRQRFEDARVHFALNRASLGCPRLPQRAFSADQLDAELDREARLFCNEERNVRIDDAAREIVLSAIFQDYEEDFTADAARRTGRVHADLLDYIAPYLTPERRAHLRRARASHAVVFARHDWRLNDATRALQAEPAQ